MEDYFYRDDENGNLHKTMLWFKLWIRIKLIISKMSLRIIQPS